LDRLPKLFSPPPTLEGPTLERIDDRFDYGEARVYAVGVTNGLEVTVIYTDVSESERRIICRP